MAALTSASWSSLLLSFGISSPLEVITRRRRRYAIGVGLSLLATEGGEKGEGGRGGRRRERRLGEEEGKG